MNQRAFAPRPLHVPRHLITVPLACPLDVGRSNRPRGNSCSRRVSCILFRAGLATDALFSFVRQACMLASIGQSSSLSLRSLRRADMYLSQALLLFETCQTADLEIASLWARGRARFILLFITIRHVQLASLILNAISTANSLGIPSPEVSYFTLVVPFSSHQSFVDVSLRTVQDPCKHSPASNSCTTVNFVGSIMTVVPYFGWAGVSQFTFVPNFKFL